MNKHALSSSVVALLLASCQAPGPTTKPIPFHIRAVPATGVVDLSSTQSAEPTTNALASPSTRPVNPDDVIAKLPAADAPPAVKAQPAPPVAVAPPPPVEPVTPADPDANKPVGELMQSKASLPAYSEEVYRIVNQPDEIVTVLRSGATVICKRIASPVLALRAYTYTGGVYEGKWLGGGLSHLLEHLVAGGTNGRRSEEQNRDLLQKLGNNSNAYTSSDHTCFYVNSTKENLDDAVDLVTGWMLTATITPAEYRREYQVVQRELEMGRGNPDSRFYQLTEANRYKVSPAKVPVIGYQEVIQGLSRDDVYSYYKLAYQPNNLVFAIAGDLDPAEMLKAMQKHLTDAKPGREFTREIPPEPPVLAPRTVVATFPNLGQARLSLAFPSVRLQHPDLYALDLLATVLGGGESSILTQEIRDKQQLVSEIGASDYTPSYVDGTFALIMQLDVDKIAPATEATLAELDKIAKGGVDADRLARAKSQMKAAHIKSNQTCEEALGNLAVDFMSTGDAHFSDQYVEKISKITPDQIKAVAAKYFDRSKLLTTAMLPAEDPRSAKLPKAEDVLRAAATTAPSTQAVAEASSVTRVELENGTVLLHKRIKTSPLVEVQMYSLGGVTAEDARSNGIGNLVMEMLPRGTKTKSADQIAEFFDAIGGDLETVCGNNTWGVNVTCLKDDFVKSMEVAADVINNPKFDDRELATLKERIAAEIESKDASWDAEAIRFFREKFYGPQNSPYQFDAMGTKENVKTFSPDDLRRWYTQKVLAAPRVVAIYGDVDLKDAQTLVATYFGGGEKASVKRVEVKFPPPPAPNSRPGINVERFEIKKTDKALAGVVIGFKSNSVLGDPANATFTLGQTLTSGFGYPTGYLFDTLRGKGLVYVVAAGNSPGRSTDLPGVFRVYAGCEPSKVNEVVDLILLNIARLQGSDEDIQPKWFDRSKVLITTSDALSNETPAAQARTAALDELLGLGYDEHDRFAGKIKAVTLGDVQNLARTRLRDCVVTVSTPDPASVNSTTGVRVYDKFPPVELTQRGPAHGATK